MITYEQKYTFYRTSGLFTSNKITPPSRYSCHRTKSATNHYTKKLDGYNHLITLLFSNFAACDSLREVVVGMLSMSNKLTHLGLSYIVRRSTLSYANKRRNSAFFATIYSHLYHKYAKLLSDSRPKNECKLYIMDSTTITLFKQILKGAGRNPKRGKKKGSSMKVHTLIASDENIPKLVIMSSAATHDHIMLKELKLSEGSFVVFDRAYVDYAIYESFSEQNITYVTKLKKNAKHRLVTENDILDDADDAILIDEVVEFRFGEKHCSKHRARRIACWDEKSRRVVAYLTNNFELSADEIVEIYRRRWQIEVFFKQMKQNFQLKYFSG